MDVQRQYDDRNATVANAASLSPGGAVSTQQPESSAEKSWGDKYKEKSFSFLRNVLLNYVVNFGISAAFTYKVMKSNWGQKHFGENIPGGNTVDKFAAQVHDKIKIPPGVTKFVTKYFTIAQLLMFGGHAILPLMKYSHDHKKSMEFVIGHRLDQLQEFTGQGNAASKRRLKEYKVVSDILKARPSELSEQYKALLAKNGIGDNLQFEERPSKWVHILKARLGGVLATTSLSVALGLASSTKINMLDFEKFAKDKMGEKIGDRVLKPVFGRTVENHKLLGQYVFTELVFTLASKLGFDREERKQFKKQREEEMAAAAEALKRDEKALTQLGAESFAAEPQTQFTAQVGRSPAMDARRKILGEGEKDFRARESGKTASPAVAMS
jgi:hypothetical protein